MTDSKPPEYVTANKSCRPLFTKGKAYMVLAHHYGQRERNYIQLIMDNGAVLWMDVKDFDEVEVQHDGFETP